MKRYEYRGFPDPTRVRIALAEKRLTDRVTFVTVDVPAGEARRAPFLAKNPAGDSALARRPFPAGGAFSMADVIAYVGLGFAEFVRLAVAPELAHLAAWRAQIATRPSFAAA